METCASESSDECLITDLVHELSSRLEIPLLLDDSFKISNEMKHSPPDTAFYDEQMKETWDEDPYFSFVNSYESSFSVNDDSKNDLQSFLEKSNIAPANSTNVFSGSGSGSGSECSSTEIWINKCELDTPPITPPDERISPENVFLLCSDEKQFIPISTEGSPKEEIKSENDFKTFSKRVRIQPKPVSTTLNIFDSQSLDFQTVACNLFPDVDLGSHNQNVIQDSKIFLNSIAEKKKLSSKKDLELLQAKRKQERMIRNRESAYLSRKRKKEHVASLEKQVQDLQTENKQLKLENHNLRQRLAKYEILEQDFEKKHKNLFTNSPRKTTALLALLFTVCLNIGSFSSFFNDRKIFKSEDLFKENVVPNYESELRNSRSLLWANNDFENLNSTYKNLTKTSCPLYFNQTESIRLESELRRWIGGDEDYTKLNAHNVTKISQYFLLGDRPRQLKNVSKRKRRVQKPKFQKKNLEMYQMNRLHFNTFFEAIHRRDDTFYLVSFSSDHLLLPALAHNQTSRPKMSLMLPASFSNGTGPDQVEMMQIDCEVTNTQLLSVNENDIPSHMRPYTNTTNSKRKADTKRKEFEEYFVSDLPVALVPAKKNNYEVKETDLTYDGSVKNQTGFYFKSFSSSSTKTNLSNSSDDDLVNLNLHFNSSHSKNNEIHNSQYLLFNRSSNVFYNYTAKRDQYLSTLKKLLKLLMLGPTTSNNEAMKLSPEKSLYKDFKNITKFLFN